MAVGLYRIFQLRLRLRLELRVDLTGMIAIIAIVDRAGCSITVVVMWCGVVTGTGSG
jgi:hypothetical protein